MSGRNISNFLKQLRKTSGYSANEVIEKLKTYDIDISVKTLYGYESGLSMPNADVFVALCRIYKCDNPMDIFETPSFNQSEISIIEKYRTLDDHGKELVNMILEKEHSRCCDFMVPTLAGPLLVETVSSTSDGSERASRLHSYASAIAAHNDHADEPDEQEKMLEDIFNLKRPE